LTFAALVSLSCNVGVIFILRDDEAMLGGSPGREVTMCCCPPSAVDDHRPSNRLSVHDHCQVEAERHKWIESQKVGYDLGEIAIRWWVRHHWHGYLRARWLEHLEGRTFWIELDHDDFGLLKNSFQDSTLIDPIVSRLKSGWENLEVILWAMDSGQKIVEVLDILEQLDINSRRIECQLEARLSHAG
jgi:hypothetical protein